ncbi:hypothetical protein WJX79_010290 [Trebouxia sp. C0005]
MKSGLLAPAKVEELLIREYNEELKPGLYSDTGKNWLEGHKGSHVALLVAHWSQREVNWQSKFTETDLAFKRGVNSALEEAPVLLPSKMKSLQLQRHSHSHNRVSQACTNGQEILKIRVGIPSKKGLERVKLRWADGMIVDHDGSIVIPSSPLLNPGAMNTSVPYQIFEGIGSSYGHILSAICVKQHDQYLQM